jgi:hypothetical protein
VGVVRFDPRRADLLLVDDKRYFLLKQGSGAAVVVAGNCPHRGGPLHLAEVAPGGLRCPWHGREVPLSLLVRKALPMVLRDECAAVVLPEAGSAYVDIRCGVALCEPGRAIDKEEG